MAFTERNAALANTTTVKLIHRALLRFFAAIRMPLKLVIRLTLGKVRSEVGVGLGEYKNEFP